MYARRQIVYTKRKNEGTKCIYRLPELNVNLVRIINEACQPIRGLISGLASSILRLYIA